MSHGHVSPTDKLNLAAVGIGGMGHANINNVKGTENIVALCDVDWKYAKGVFDEFPNAKKYWDYRKMYDEMGKSIDGVIMLPPTILMPSSRRRHDNGQARILPETVDSLRLRIPFADQAWPPLPE